VSETPLADTTSPVAGVTRPLGARPLAGPDGPDGPGGPPTDAAVAAAVAQQDSAPRIFSQSVVISGIRCLLAYIVFPWVLPALGVAGGVGPWIGIAIGVVAIGFNVASIRRFWRADHRWKWPISIINGTVIGMLLVLLAMDISSL
jgi:hypothetical protein